MRVLITGGAGYIGSHTAKALARDGHEPIVLDNLQRGHRWAVRWGPLVEMDLSDRQHLARVFEDFRFDAVIHFAAFAFVGESMKKPGEYLRNNVVNTLNLLDAMREAGVTQMVFSSTCATYGNPERSPISEEHSEKPINPYGESKLMVERALGWYGQIYGLSWTALRYFNAAGADPDGELGEAHYPEPHLIPRAVAAAHGHIPQLEIYGADYDTSDGTAVRDYIHVTDLASAHLKALERLRQGGPSGIMNLGTGEGYTVRQVIGEVERTGRCRVPLKEGPRRLGDAPVLVADASKAARELGWTPQHSSIEEIVATMLRWYGCHPQLYTGHACANVFPVPTRERDENGETPSQRPLQATPTGSRVTGDKGLPVLQMSSAKRRA
jgi:UDP-arabinose 4-epimerase